MSIKDEVERLKQEQKDREVILKAELIRELDSIFPIRVRECHALVERHLKALQATNCVSYFEDLRQSYNLIYERQFASSSTQRTSPAIASITVGIDLSSCDGRRLSSYVVCDPSTFQATIDLTPIYRDWVFGISSRVYSLTQDLNALQAFRDRLRAILNNIRVAETYARLAWDHESYTDPSEGGGWVDVETIIQAAVTHEVDEWQLIISSGRVHGTWDLQPNAQFSQSEWDPSRIKRAIAQAYVKLTWH